MSTVWVPQQPSRFDRLEGLWLPTVNLNKAAVYGQVEVLLPPSISPIALAPIMHALKEKLKESGPEDYLLALGDPSVIALCAVILARKHNKLKMLKWDKDNADYIKVEIEL